LVNFTTHKITFKKMNDRNKDWKSILTEEEYKIMREKGTERPFSGKYNLHFENGVYLCKGCGEPLFDSASKFDAGCGWPSFDKEIQQGKIKEVLDKSHGMIRVEIICANCDSHLGHVFNDGPTATGLRYCVNSVSLDFNKEE
jgi:peptide-methionine (R)-S-oxide reductase